MSLIRIKEIVETYTNYTIEAKIVYGECDSHIIIKDKGNRFLPFRADELKACSKNGLHVPDILAEIYDLMTEYISNRIMEYLSLLDKDKHRDKYLILKEITEKYEWLDVFKTYYEIVDDIHKKAVELWEPKWKL